MKILFNCSTNIVGGAVKNSAFFIKESLSCKELLWVYAISPNVKEVLDRWGVELSNSYLFVKSPSKDKGERIRLKKISNIEKVDIVYTMAGPAYVNFDMYHILGISNPYLTHVDLQAFLIGKNFLELMKFSLLTLYQSFYARKADFWIFQTNESQKGFVKRFFVSQKKTTVVPNSIGNEFKTHFSFKKKHIINNNKKVMIFCPAAGYIHKGLQFIPKIAYELKKIVNNKYNFEFILTIDEKSKLWSDISLNSEKLNIKANVLNHGAYNYADAIQLFDDSDIVFIPSVLETFSSSYLEAFASKRVLIAAKKGFSKDICKTGAFYLEPNKSYQSAELINEIINNKALQTLKIEEGLRILNEYSDQQKRVNEIIKIIKNNYENKK